MTAPHLELLTNNPAPAGSDAALAPDRIDPKLLAQISDEVANVDEELARHVGSGIGLVQHVGEHTLHAGGKRIRPAFVALAAQATGLSEGLDRVVRLGACMELIHMATLIHDDVIDNATTRRGRPTAGAVFGNQAAILTGDVLLAKAMTILAEDGDLAVIRLVSSAVVEMAEGEVRELEIRGDFDLDEATHLEVLRMKTARFIEACAEVGALAMNASPEMHASLARYGFHVGMAFQIVDDLLDYRGDRARTGKPQAGDFREGQATLPLIYLRPALTDGEARLARLRFGNGASDDEVRMIVDWMETRGAFRRAEEAARQHVSAAHSALALLPDTEAGRMLHAVADYVLLRQS